MQTAYATTCFPVFAALGPSVEPLAELPPQPETSSPIATIATASEAARRSRDLRILDFVVDHGGILRMSFPFGLIDPCRTALYETGGDTAVIKVVTGL